MIKQISFGGIKNIGYVHVTSNDEGDRRGRSILNMELTDEGNKDLTEFRRLLAKNPQYKNKINDKFINIEIQTREIADQFVIMPKLNGIYVGNRAKNVPILNYMKKMVNQVSKMKEEEFKVDKEFQYRKEATNGLIYKEDIVDYISGYSGRITMLEGTGLTEQFDLYWNGEDPESENFGLDKKARQICNAMDDIVEVLHNPCHVHNGSMYLGAVLKSCDEATSHAN